MFISFSLLHVFNNCNGLFWISVFMSIVENVKCVWRDRVICFDISCMFLVSYFYRFPVWPTYDLLHVLHCNLYIPLEFILFSDILSHKWLYIVLHSRSAMFKAVLEDPLFLFKVRSCDSLSAFTYMGASLAENARIEEQLTNA